MYLKKFKPKVNSLRNKIILKIQKYVKLKRLMLSLKKKNGKNFNGNITVRHKGGGVKFLYRIIDNFNFKYNYDFYLQGYDYCYYRNSILGSLKSTTNLKKYTILPEGIKLQKKLKTTFNFIDKKENLGDCLPIGWIPNNTLIFNLENKPLNGSKYIKAGGTYGKILKHTKNHVKILLPSKKKKYFSKYCFASIGRTSNLFYKFQNYGKAGYLRNLNIRPNVKGENMNSCDHPNGGRTRGGKPTKNLWGSIIK